MRSGKRVGKKGRLGESRLMGARSNFEATCECFEVCVRGKGSWGGGTGEWSSQSLILAGGGGKGEQGLIKVIGILLVLEVEDAREVSKRGM